MSRADPKTVATLKKNSRHVIEMSHLKSAAFLRSQQYEMFQNQ